MTISSELPYLHFLGLSRSPFPVTPDADDFFESTDIDTTITELVHGISTRKGFFVLTGEVGVGKTTISRRILQLLTDAGVSTSLVFHSLLPKLGLIKHINKDFGVADQDSNLDDELGKLSDFVLKENELGNNCAIIIDDAQNLSWESLEIIRMISNLEGNSQKLVQILLIGQPELAEKLNSNNLRQLKSRIVIQREISTLSKDGLRKYIDFKLTVAGPTRLQTPDKVIKTIHTITGGNLRGVNILMDRCLYIAYADQSHTLTPQMVHKAATDLKMPSKGLSRHPKLIIATLVLFTAGLATLGLNRPLQTSLSSTPPPASQKTTTGTIAQNSIVPEAVTTFLQGYNLLEYAQPFWRGIENGNLHTIRQEIQKSTGLEIVTLPCLPKSLQNMDVLQISTRLDKLPRFLFFWQPQLVIDDFYYNFQGNKIVQLQYMLAAGHYYQGAIDGIVGRKLLQAIIDFQVDMGLSLSGLPDQPTLFVLCSLTTPSGRK